MERQPANKQKNRIVVEAMLPFDVDDNTEKNC